jgi:hypothetical protein
MKDTMKKINLLLVFIFITANIMLAGNEPDGITLTRVSDGYLVSFRLPEFQQNLIKAEGEDYIEIQVPAYGTTSEVGKPALPLISFNIAVPYDLEEVQYQVHSKNEQVIPLNSKIYPFQPPWEKSKPLSERPFVIDKAYYQTDGSILPFVSVTENFIIGGVKGFLIVVQPFSYNPAQNKLTAITEGSFKITVPDGEVETKRSSYYDTYLQQVFVNYNPVSSSRLMRYLIITAPEFESGLTPFINHKSAIGYVTDVFNTTATGTTTTAIKNFIQQRYNNSLTKPEFILLVGDVDKIPAWTGTGEGSPKTDLNYACLEGTDFFADAFLGRFSITNLTELQNIINKTLYMENNLPTLTKKNVYMASTDNYSITEGTHNYVINNYFSPNNYTNLKLYTYTYSATTAQLITALNNNQLFAIYSGHGATTYWADGPQLTQTQVRSLTNSVYPFVYSFACITGDYNYSECFAETWIRTAKGGSSFYGSSVNSYWTEDDILEKVLYKAMFVDNITKVTPMFDKSKVYLVNHFGSLTATMKRYLEMYNLMGDPSLETTRHILPDTTPPDPVTNLALLNPSSNKIMLNWTSPYDSTVGGVTAYDIRFSTNPITASNFNQASQRMLTGQSDPAGVPKSFQLDSLNPATLYYAAIKALDMWGNISAISNLPSLSTLSAPQIAVNPGSLSMVMRPDSSKVENILVSNICPSPSTLDYQIDLINNTFPGEITFKLLPVINDNSEIYQRDKDDVSEEPSGISFKGSGGPDAFGYKWKDSNDPNGPQYVWNNITATGTQVTNWISFGSTALDDGYSGPYPIGFNFKFYGDVKTQFYIHTNGLIVFTQPAASWITNGTIPGTAEPNAFLAPLWDDLDGRTQGTVHYKQETDRLIIQYTNWQRYSGSGSLTFQVVLHKNGKINYYYNNLVGDLNSCTVGIEGPGGTTGLQVTYNAAYLANNKAIQFAAEPEWLITNNTSGMITSGNSVSLVLNVNTNGLEFGSYSIDVRIQSNCGVHPNLIIPVTLTVSDQISFQLAVSVENSWNLVSIPGLHPVNQNVNTWWAFKDPETSVFIFQNGYQAVTSATPGTGYWMKHSGSRIYNTGDEWPASGINYVPNSPINASAGWNLIGGYHYNAPVSGITTLPAGSIVGNLFGYSTTSGYLPATQLVPGFGYFIKLVQTAQILLPNPSFKGSDKLAYDVNDQWGKIIISDNAGRHYILYAADGDVNLDAFDLPSTPPDGMFDVRFESQRYVENINTGFQTINLNGVEYPVNIKTENISIRIQDETGKVLNAALKPGEDISLSSNSINKLLISGEIVPEHYSLGQNYPNPFNPSTTIQFSVPEDVENLKLTIYNSLGEKVAELANTPLQAGYYNYKWDAGNNASGIYIYQIVTEKFIATKKMILMK